MLFKTCILFLFFFYILKNVVFVHTTGSKVLVLQAIEVWNDIRIKKWWHRLHFQVNDPFKGGKGCRHLHWNIFQGHGLHWECQLCRLPVLRLDFPQHHTKTYHSVGNKRWIYTESFPLTITRLRSSRVSERFEDAHLCMRARLFNLSTLYAWLHFTAVRQPTRVPVMQSAGAIICKLLFYVAIVPLNWAIKQG